MARSLHWTESKLLILQERTRNFLLIGIAIDHGQADEVIFCFFFLQKK